VSKLVRSDVHPVAFAAAGALLRPLIREVASLHRRSDWEVGVALLGYAVKGDLEGFIRLFGEVEPKRSRASVLYYWRKTRRDAILVNPVIRQKRLRA